MSDKQYPAERSAAALEIVFGAAEWLSLLLHILATPPAAVRQLHAQNSVRFFGCDVPGGCFIVLAYYVKSRAGLVPINRNP